MAELAYWIIICGALLGAIGLAVKNAPTFHEAAKTDDVVDTKS